MYVVHVLVCIINCARCTVHTSKYKYLIHNNRLFRRWVSIDLFIRGNDEIDSMEWEHNDKSQNIVKHNLFDVFITKMFLHFFSQRHVDKNNVTLLIVWFAFIEKSYQPEDGPWNGRNMSLTEAT
jgi:hypothetical protein